MLRKCIITLALGLILVTPALARDYEDGTMYISPKLFVVDYQESCLTIHTGIPFGDVDMATLELYGVGGASILPVCTKSDLSGDLVVKFAADDVRAIVAPPKTELSLTGLYVGGESFALYGTILVK